MAYARKRRYTRRSGSSRAKRTTRPSARRYRSTGRTRRYTRKRPMSKRSILNVTSRKKRDTMLSYANTNAAGAQQTPAPGPLYVKGDIGAYCLWIATGRDLTPGSGGLGTVSNESTRTATNCYMRGLSDKLRIQTSSGLPWFHRRIVFTAKGIDPFRQGLSTDTGAPQLILENSNGMVRLLFNSLVNNTPNYLNNVNEVIFKGAQGVDWSDFITAPTDPRRITVKFDKTWTMQSGNNLGVVRERKLWHGMNKSLVYGDDESGTSESTPYFSTNSKAGMGDLYVLDFIQPGTGGTATDLMRLESTATLYWHER
nr:capsid protein [Plant associated genomovirus 8]